MGVESLLGDLWQLLQLAGLLSALAVAIAVTVRWPAVGIAAPLALALTLWEWPRAPRVGSALGFDIYLDDVVVVILGGALVVNLVRGKVALRSFHVAALVLTLAMLGALLAGIQTLPLGSVVVEARGYLFVMVSILWATSVTWQPGALERVTVRVSAAIAMALVALGVFHGVVHGVGAADDLVTDEVGEVLQTGRILTAGQALVLGTSVLVMLARPRSTWPRFGLPIGLLSIATLVVSQQRTALIALVVGAVAVFLRSRAKQRMAIVLAVSAMALLVAVVYATDLWAALREDLAGSATSTGTYEGRLASWHALVNDAFGRGAGVVLFGRPFGSGFGRLDPSGAWVEYAPHNWYVSVFLRTGAIGLIALGWLMVAALRRAWSLAETPWVVGAWVALVVFGWGYSWPWYVMPLLAAGLALPMVTRRPHAERARSSYRRAQPGSSGSSRARA